MFAVAEQGDKCLVPAPYYSQFDRDLGMRAGVEIKRVHCSAMDRLSASAFEDAWDPKCKVLLLTNPSNPLGTVYHRQELESILTWAHEKNLHVISDEIYACSVYDPRGDGDGDSGFVSCIVVGQNAIANLLESSRVDSVLNCAHMRKKQFEKQCE